MTFVMLLLVGLYAAIGAALVWLYRAEPSWGVWITLLAIAICASAVLHLVRADQLLLSSAGAHRTRKTTAADVQARVERIAALATGHRGSRSPTPTTRTRSQSPSPVSDPSSS